MRKEKKRRTVKPDKHEAETCPMIISQVTKSMPRMRTVKLKEKMNTSKKKSTSDRVTTWETSGNRMRLCVNLMPVLAAAKEPKEEDEEDERGEEEENTCRNEPTVTKQTPDFVTGGSQSHQCVLPPLTQHKPAPDRGHTRGHTPLPPISSSKQTRIVSSEVSVKVGGGQRSVTDSRPWIDNPLFSKSKSPDFRLPDVSLSSLDALLQTVTQRMGRRRRRGGDEGLFDHRLVAVGERVRERRVTDNRNLLIIDAVTETSVGVNRQRSLPPLISAPKPTLILTMTKKNLLNTLQ